jgi:hypothetical protein
MAEDAQRRVETQPAKKLSFKTKNQPKTVNSKLAKHKKHQNYNIKAVCKKQKSTSKPNYD